MPDLNEFMSFLTPAIVNIIQSYAPPMTRTINGHSLENDIWLTAEDVGARSNNWLPTPDEIGAAKIPNIGTEDNFMAFDENKNIKDSGKNANSFLPAKYTNLDSTKVLQVDGTGTVQAVEQESLIDFIKIYSSIRAYRENEVFYYTDAVEGRGIYVTTIPHEAEGFNPDHNLLIAKVGMDAEYLNPTLSTPAPNSNYVLQGSLQQLLQGLLNNIKDLQDKIAAIDAEYVRTDTPKVKLNISSTPSSPQSGYYIVRIDPAEILN